MNITQPHELVRRTDPDTSVEAAYSIQATELEAVVYEVIESFGEVGCTSDEIERALFPMKAASITPRYAPLIRKNIIFDTGVRKKGSSKRMQRVLCSIKFKDKYE